MAILITLASFNLQTGAARAGLVADADGDLFGTTVGPGGSGTGTVFEIAKTADGYASAPVTLVSFDGANSAIPSGTPIVDAGGNIFGATSTGGTDYSGTVFEIPNTPGGYPSTPTTLVNFAYTNGYGPFGSLLPDAAGNLFGVTPAGGPGAVVGGTPGDGTVYEIVKTGGSYADTPTALVNFNGADGAGPSSPLIVDQAGDLFGTTASGGPSASNYGTVFEIAKTEDGYASAPATLATFINDANGYGPGGKLVMDAAGNLFGTAGGGSSGGGTVFEIPKTADGYADKPATLFSFDPSFTATNGADPSDLIIDAAGNLFGTTSGGMASLPGTSYGTVFELAKTADGYAAAPATLVRFNSADGSAPTAGLLADAAGNLFGTTGNGYGYSSMVFELTDTGFQVACFRQGTQIATPTGQQAVELLAEGDLLLNAFGAARKITWIGRRHIDCRHHRKPSSVWPIRLRAGAFGETGRRGLTSGIPSRDLWLSPDHAVFVGDVLIPIKHLINGRSILQEPVDDVTYFHVALPTHDVVLAEGLPVESYLRIGRRDAFGTNQGRTSLHPDLHVSRREAEGIAPLAVDGARLQTERRRINSLAVASSVSQRQAERSTRQTV